MDNKIILRYIIGKANKNDKHQIAVWLQEDADNINKLATMKAQYVFSGMPNSIVPEKRRVRPIVTHVAAGLAIPLLALGVYFFCINKQTNERLAVANRQIEVLSSQNHGIITYTANPGVKSTVVLPDSSVVRLNGDSKLVVPDIFAPDIRELFLSGEGYFEVKHHENWPMHIHTAKDVTVKVLGTTFDLSAYENDQEVKLTLIEGTVLMQNNKTRSEHEVKPQQEIKISDNCLAAMPEIKKADMQKNTCWTKGELLFDNTPMPEIVKQLERWYGVRVHIADRDILSYHLTARFTNESITRVLDLIRFSSMIDYEIRGTDVYINKTSANSI